MGKATKLDCCWVYLPEGLDKTAHYHRQSHGIIMPHLSLPPVVSVKDATFS